MPEIKNSHTEDTLLMSRPSEGLSPSHASVMRLSKGEIEDLREAFRLFDTDGKGVISMQDLKEVAESLALEMGNQQNAFSTHSFRHLSDMLHNVQADNDEENDENEFVRLMSDRRYEEEDSRDEYQRVFDLFDAKGKGYINIADLRRISEELGETMAEEELDEMISKAAPKNGKVTPEDFQRIMTKRLFA
ncbi:Putative calmodulin-like protein [Seminavis robusta]|uniref:Calmodulin n=1 Tax=Seminavis robusta TaxID=568900 RepID=A0A9N8DWS9_9STRA|nr:Putative calmodulin-like protein [Seminavis robusta]|eukprot:Sro426_g140290.1 Putative calmodulin-like protein (190) ;mRNA; f:8239-8997